MQAKMSTIYHKCCCFCPLDFWRARRVHATHGGCAPRGGGMVPEPSRPGRYVYL